MASESFNQGDKIGVIGTGLVGRGWAMLFAAYGFKVSIYDIDPARVTDALNDIKIQLGNLSELGHLRGKLSVSQQQQLITSASSLQECVDQAVYVQESVPESIEIRRSLYKQLDEVVQPGTVLASSTSTIPSSMFASDLVHKGQVLVVHPIYPIYYFRMAEVVPSPHTDPAITERTKALLRHVEQTPILQKKEIVGFAANRINTALMSECWRLVQEDVISPEEMDALLTNGLGMRYSLMGMFETAHITANGFMDMVKKYGPFIASVQDTGAERIKITHESPTAERIAAAMTAKVPLDKLQERNQEYLKHLSQLSHFKSQLPPPTKY